MVVSRGYIRESRLHFRTINPFENLDIGSLIQPVLRDFLKRDFSVGGHPTDLDLRITAASFGDHAPYYHRIVHNQCAANVSRPEPLSMLSKVEGKKSMILETAAD